MNGVVFQVIFLAFLATAFFLIFKRIRFIRRTIQLGKEENLTDVPAERIATMLRVAFGQQKMFDRPLVGLLHFVVYAGFVLINIEVLEIILDGLLGTHRILATPLGDFYSVIIGIFELLALGVIFACSVFLVRRSSVGVERLQDARHRELKGWAVLDARLILTLEIVLMIALLTMNAADTVLQSRQHAHYSPTGPFWVSQWLTPWFAKWSNSTLVLYERLAWWTHIIGILGFGIYVTYSKHLHILLAFPNTYFFRRKPVGEMTNMPEITKEVRLMMGLEESSEPPAEIPRFGAKDVSDLSWKNLMDAYSCTECGRCTSVCPANITGKLLSPRKIMMDTRDRLEEVGQVMEMNNGTFVPDGKALLGDYIQQEELLACTTCNACVQECPILISPLDIIMQLRRYKVMDEGEAPVSWNMMFQNMETNQSPWKFPISDRTQWLDRMNNE